MEKAKNRKPLKLFRVTVSKARFDVIPESERLLFIRFGHLIDEINTLLRVFLWSTPTERLKEEERNGRSAQCMVIARVLTGKMYEAYGLIKRHYIGEKISVKYDSLLNDTAREALRCLKRYFSKPNLINAVRNKYAFHYLHEELAKFLIKIPTEDNLIFYLSQDSRNSLFCSADAIVCRAMLDAIEPDQPDVAQRRLEEETIQVTKWLQSFLNWYMYTVMKRYLGKNFNELGAKEIVIYPPKDTEIEIPYFVCLEKESK
ncbi:MAG: hypothetical protein ABSE05_15125 [Syntrophales bacterium]|jgi:hypothetical protein